jgi:hypothetical protein
MAWNRGGKKKNEDGISLSIPCLNPTTIVKKGPRRGRAENCLRKQNRTYQDVDIWMSQEYLEV